MRSIILDTASRLLQPLLLLFSIFLLIRGHQSPGGGFVGGLVAVSALVLRAIADDTASVRAELRFAPRTLIGIGLLSSLASGAIGLLAGRPFLTGLWGKFDVPALGTVEVGTPFLFELGVYLLVVGAALTIVFELMEER